MTDHHVFVVSDRRMTDGRTGRIMSSAENKAVVLNSEMVLTYTGLCNLDGIPTDAWVTEVLVQEPVENWLPKLLNYTGPAVRRTRLRPDLQRHSFMLTGFMKTPRGRYAYRPVGFLISNCHREDGTTMRLPESQFSLSLLRLGNQKARIDSIGRDLKSKRRIELEKAVRRQLRANPEHPERILDILGAEIRLVSSRDSGVGSDLMAVSFPMKAVHTPLTGVFDLSEAAWRESLISYYAAVDETMVSYGPGYVTPGFQMLGLSVSNDPDNSPAEVHRLMGFPRSPGRRRN